MFYSVIDILKIIVAKSTEADNDKDGMYQL